MPSDHKIQSSIDAFHKGGFYLKQPINSGHRAGIDAMLLASLVPEGASSTLADLGAGAGAAGMAVASRSKIQALLVEADPRMAKFANESIALEQNQHLANRCKVLCADVELSGQDRIKAGLIDNHFNYVIMNPPFNEPNDRATPDGLKAKAHVMSDDLFEKWIKTAAAIAKPKGILCLIARPSSLSKILNACIGRFGGIELTSVQPKINEAAIRVLVTGVKSSKARMIIRPSLIMHEGNDDGANNDYTELAEALINGRKFLPRLG